jgi:TetR/AcrR family transcriptional regulator, cholesterol catabolism regulator
MMSLSNARFTESIKGHRMKKATVPSPQRRNREVEVLDAATEVFAQKGYPAASIQEVADRVGVLKGSLYYYIQSKEDLLARIVDEVHGQSAAILAEVHTLDVTPLDRIRIYIERHVEWYLRNRTQVSVFFREWRHLTGERLESVMERRRGYDIAMRELVSAAQDAGEIDPGLQPRYASLFILAAVNSVPDWYNERGPDSPGRIAETYADMTVGLLKGTRVRADIHVESQVA